MKGGVLSRARAGTQRRTAHARALAPAYTQHTTTHSARRCNMLPSLWAVADVCQATVDVAMMCLLVLASQPGPLLDGHVRGGGSAAVVPRGG